MELLFQYKRMAQIDKIRITFECVYLAQIERYVNCRNKCLHTVGTRLGVFTVGIAYLDLFGGGPQQSSTGRENVTDIPVIFEKAIRDPSSFSTLLLVFALFEKTKSFSDFNHDVI